LKLEIEPYPHPYTIEWIKKSPSIKLTGRPWKHDVDATHNGKEKIYMFT